MYQHLSSLSLPVTITKPLSPPSSFHSQVLIARPGRSSGFSTTPSAGSSSDTTTITSSSSSSSSSALFSPKSLKSLFKKCPFGNFGVDCWRFQSRFFHFFSSSFFRFATY
ncbi:hypothetical protein BYT27DRAFT_6605048 [Phlegmacium glaucopus]|nr:hypothetical protein BYT27DRAFT_6605048 [Phlegmacium glaucopus]